MTTVTERREDATGVLGLAAAYRHALLNHLQVLSGWLHLGQPQRAAEHLDMLIDLTLGETRLVRAAHPHAAAVLLLRRGFAEGHGIEVRFEAGEDLRGFAWPPEVPDELVAATIDAVVAVLGGRVRGQEVEVAISEADGRQSLAVSVEGAVLPCALVAEEADRLLQDRRAGMRFQEALARFEACGGRWACYQDGPRSVVEISWPRP